RDFVEPLKTQGYRVIVPDCIGAGYSSKPLIDTAYSLAHHIADLVSLIDQLELNAIAIVGQDWGGPQEIVPRQSSGVDEHLVLYRLCRAVSPESAAMDDMARASDRSDLPEAFQGAEPRRTVHHQQAPYAQRREAR